MADRGRQRVRDSRIVGAELDTVHGAPVSNTFSGAGRRRLPRRSPVGPVGRLQSRDARRGPQRKRAAAPVAHFRARIVPPRTGAVTPAGSLETRVLARTGAPRPPRAKLPPTQDLLESVAGAAVLAGRRGATPLASQE